MRARLPYTVSQLATMAIDRAILAIGQMLDALIAAVNALSLGPYPVNNARPGQLDAVWVTGRVISAATAQTFPHALGRVPSGFLEVKTTPDPNFPSTIPGSGNLQMTASTSSTITITSSTANNEIRLLLF